MISALALFSAHQTHHSAADKPDYARNPAMVRPGYVPGQKPAKTKKKLKAQGFAQAKL
jgi:hypothetical protein